MTPSPKLSTGPNIDYEASQAGKDYTQLIHALAYGEETVETNRVPAIQELALRTQIALERQQLEYVTKDMAPIDLLRQAFSKEKLENVSIIDFKNPSAGIFRLWIDQASYKTLKAESRGVAVFINNGISFVLLPKYEGETEKRENEENIPHETHHIIWRLGKGSDLIDISETDPEKRRLYLSFINELIATIVSNGVLHGHCQGKTLPPEYQEANEILMEMNQLLKKAPEKRMELLYFILGSKNIQELLSIISDKKDKLEQEQGPTESTRNGWNTIGI